MDIHSEKVVLEEVSEERANTAYWRGAVAGGIIAFFTIVVFGRNKVVNNHYHYKYPNPNPSQ